MPLFAIAHVQRLRDGAIAIRCTDYPECEVQGSTMQAAREAFGAALSERVHKMVEAGQMPRLHTFEELDYAFSVRCSVEMPAHDRQPGTFDTVIAVRAKLPPAAAARLAAMRGDRPRVWRKPTSRVSARQPLPGRGTAKAETAGSEAANGEIVVRGTPANDRGSVQAPSILAPAAQMPAVQVRAVQVRAAQTPASVTPPAKTPPVKAPPVGVGPSPSEPTRDDVKALPPASAAAKPSKPVQPGPSAGVEHAQGTAPSAKKPLEKPFIGRPEVATTGTPKSPLPAPPAQPQPQPYTLRSALNEIESGLKQKRAATPEEIEQRDKLAKANAERLASVRAARASRQASPEAAGPPSAPATPKQAAAKLPPAPPVPTREAARDSYTIESAIAEIEIGLRPKRETEPADKLGLAIKPASAPAEPARAGKPGSTTPSLPQPATPAAASKLGPSERLTGVADQLSGKSSAPAKTSRFGLLWKGRSTPAKSPGT